MKNKKSIHPTSKAKLRLAIFLTSFVLVFNNNQIVAQSNDTTSIKATQIDQNQAISNNEPYECVDEMPTFPGGESALFQHIAMCLKCPKKDIIGKSYVRVIINKNGEIEKPIIIRSLNKRCDKEAINVVRTLPKWIPGKLNGKNVAVYLTIPISFNKPKENVLVAELNSEIESPQFPGGDLELAKLIVKSIRYPIYSMEHGEQGEVIVRATITATGEISNPTIIKSVSRDCDKEAIRVIQCLPKLIPAKRNGVNIPVYYNIPIHFILSKSTIISPF